MNKRQRLADIRHKILARTIELFGDEMSFAEAERLATQQVAAQERLKPRDMPRTEPAPTSTADNTASNLREELFAKIMGMHKRIKNRVTTAAARTLIPRVRLREDDASIPPTPAPVEPKPAPSSTYTEVYCGRPTSMPISDEEFPAGLVDTTTQNWRRSIESSKPRVPENEVNPLDHDAVEAALQRQNIIAFPRVSK